MIKLFVLPGNPYNMRSMILLCCLMLKLVSGHPKMSTFSQVYKPYARGEGVTPDVRF